MKYVELVAKNEFTVAY